jgi:hypothetical protein
MRSIKTSVINKAEVFCYYLNYYNCPPDYGGSFANCDYLGSELLGCGDETTIQCNGQCGGNIDIVVDSFYTDNPKRYVALGFLGAWKVEGVAFLKGFKFFSDSEKNYFTSVPNVNSKLVMLNSGIPPATYSSSISIGEWVIPNTSVRSRLRGPYYAQHLECMMLIINFIILLKMTYNP